MSNKTIKLDGAVDVTTAEQQAKRRPLEFIEGVGLFF